MQEVSSLKKSRINKDILYPCILSGVIVALLFCLCPFSPLYRYVFSADEICYKTVSIGLLEGKLPYRDLFDHKGPLSYFLYALGFLISGKANWGAFLIVCILNAAAFYFVYKTMRLFHDEDHAFFSSAFLLFIMGFCVENIFTTGSKPDNMLLLPLMVSTYLFLKETRHKEGEVFSSISVRSMFLIGLMCGAVFMIKLNVCLFYFAFIGMYLMFLLIRKKWKAFLTGTSAFLAGIFAVCLPLVAIMGIMKNLHDFVRIYLVYNFKYANTGDSVFYLTKKMIAAPGKLAITVLILLTVFAVVKDLKNKKLDKQRILMLVLGIAVMAFLTIGPVCIYFYIVFVPFYLYGADSAVSSILSRVKSTSTRAQIPCILSALLVIFIVIQIIMIPYIPWEKTAEEKAIEAYAEVHPDATVMYFNRLCAEGFSDYMPTTPDFRVFYAPLLSNDDFVSEEVKTIQEQKPSVVIINRYHDDSDAIMKQFMEKYGYEEYTAYTEANDGMYVFVKAAD